MTNDWGFLAPDFYLHNIKQHNFSDPIYAQIFPSDKEKIITKDFNEDPLEEEKSKKTEQLLHKYNGRVLILCTDECVLKCRFCFRRYKKTNFPKDWWKDSINYIKQDNSINEVIFSGGDPFIIEPKKLFKMALECENIEHIKTIRWHTKVPIAKPDLITEEFKKELQNIKANKIIFLHINHPNELNETVKKTIAKLKDAGAMIYSQSVLLKGINDNYKTIKELCEKNIDYGITPIYIHTLDKVKGASHFFVAKKDIIKIKDKLHANLPSYALPSFVYEKYGDKGKMQI